MSSSAQRCVRCMHSLRFFLTFFVSRRMMSKVFAAVPSHGTGTKPRSSPECSRTSCKISGP